VTRRSKQTLGTLAVIVSVGCGRSLLTLDDEGSGGATETGGRSGASGTGATSGGLAGAATTAGGTTAIGGSSSGVGGAGGTERGGTSNAGAGDGGQGPEDCDVDGDGVMSVRCGGDDCADEDPTLPDPNDSNTQTGDWSSRRIADLGGGVGMAVDGDGASHVAVAMQGQVRYFVNLELEHVLLADVQPSSEVRVALDSNGEPRILFGGLGSPINFAIRHQGSWQMQELDSDGLPVSVIVGRNDETILGYLEDPLAGRRLRFGIGYAIDLEFKVLLGPTNAAFAVGPDGELHVAWQDSDAVLRYSISDLGMSRWISESVPSELAAPPIGLSWGGLVVNRAGVPGVGIIADDVLVYLVRDPTWRKVEIPSPSDVSEPFVAIDEDGFAQLLLDTGASHLAFLSQGPDGWTNEAIWFFPPPRAFALDRFGAGHAVGALTYFTNRDIVPDSVDRDCDGADGFDRDGDGHASIITGGDDCDDHDGEIHPDVDEVQGDGVDSDCNGFGHCPNGLPGPRFVEVPYGNRGFCMDATEVTNADYAVFLASGVPASSSCRFNDTFEPAPLGTPAAFGGTCPGFLPEAMIPLTCVDWCDAWAYCAWAGKRLCGASFGRPITDPSESVWRIACDSGLMGIGDFGAVWEWQDGCTPGPGPTPASDSCPAYGGRFTTAPAPERCNESITLARGDVSDMVGFRCCDL
jgi:hypothetical protein